MDKAGDGFVVWGETAKLSFLPEWEAKLVAAKCSVVNERKSSSHVEILADSDGVFEYHFVVTI
jgi:hypothetical protein